jgi:hypothetical protein
MLPDATSLLCIHFMQFVQGTHNNAEGAPVPVSAGYSEAEDPYKDYNEGSAYGGNAQIDSWKE